MTRQTAAERERATGRLSDEDPPDVVATAFDLQSAIISRLGPQFQTTGTTRDARGEHKYH